MFYRMQILGSFNVVKSEINFESFDNKTAEWCLTREFARLFSDWSEEKIRQELLQKICIENNFLTIKGGNTAIRIIDRFETYEEGYRKGYISEKTYLDMQTRSNIASKKNFLGVD